MSPLHPDQHHAANGDRPPVWQVDRNSIHPLVTDKFANVKAVPKIVSVYYPRQGWNSSLRRTTFTLGVIQDLTADGATLVIARWRRRESKFTLSALEIPGR